MCAGGSGGWWRVGSASREGKVIRKLRSSFKNSVRIGLSLVYVWVLLLQHKNTAWLLRIKVCSYRGTRSKSSVIWIVQIRQWSWEIHCDIQLSKNPDWRIQGKGCNAVLNCMKLSHSRITWWSNKTPQRVMNSQVNNVSLIKVLEVAGLVVKLDFAHLWVTHDGMLAAISLSPGVRPWCSEIMEGECSVTQVMMRSKFCSSHPQCGLKKKRGKTMITRRH